MQPWQRIRAGLVATCCVAMLLVACGQPGATTAVTGEPATTTAATTAAATTAEPAATPTTPPRGPGSGTALLPPPGSTPSFGRPAGSPVLPGGGPQVTPTLSASAVAPAADGACPATHPVKASRLGKAYHLSESTSYARARADECFASEADAQAAGYRKAGR